MKLQLVQPTTGEYNSNSRSGCYPPLGLISIATFIAQEFPNIELEILDGELLSHQQILRNLDADVVGINANTVTYPQAIAVAEYAKKLGSQVILGGVYPSAMADTILKYRNHLFDHIVVGYGEIPTRDIILNLQNNKNFTSLPPIIINQTPSFDKLPEPNRKFVELHQYLDRFSEKHPTWSDRGTNIFTNVGCFWREKTKGGCIFCSRSGEFTATKQAAAVWSEIESLVNDYGINYLVDFSDTLLQHKAWLSELILAKPKDINPMWHVFGRTDEICQETIDLLKQLPCNHIFAGLESGHPITYKTSRKGGGSPEHSLEIGRLLRKNNMEITASYVMGLPGESEQTLKATYEHAKKMKDITGFEEIFCCPLMPFPGSVAFNQLKAKERLTSDLLDIEDLKRLWAKHYCNVPFDVIEHYAEKILALGTYKITISKRVQASTFSFNVGVSSQNSHEEQYTCV